MAEPALSAIPRVLAAVRAKLLADADLTSRLTDVPAEFGGGPGIYSEGAVPEAARPPYLTIGPFTERSLATMGDGRKWASEVGMPIKLVTQDLDVGFNLLTIDRLVVLLHGQSLQVQDYHHGTSVLEIVIDAYSDKYAGLVTLHYPTMWTVFVGQPA